MRELSSSVSIKTLTDGRNVWDAELTQYWGNFSFFLILKSVTILSVKFDNLQF